MRLSHCDLVVLRLIVSTSLTGASGGRLQRPDLPREAIS